MNRETNYDLKNLEKYLKDFEPLLVEDQRIAYNTILKKIESNKGEIFFLDAPGGTGKTFLINLLLAKIRKESKIAIAMASSGIAATLLDGGRTAHSTLKLPLDLQKNENQICGISKGSGMAKLLKDCKIIVWDECTMIHKHGLEALNRTMKDIRNNNNIMGGAVVVLAGDFRQTLPVIPRGTIADELKACLKSSILWSEVKTLKLTTNMRVHLQGDIDTGKFAKQLLDIGDGKIQTEPNSTIINLPNDFCNLVNTIDELKNNVFTNLLENYKNLKWLCERAILAPKNDRVNEINYEIQKLIPEETITYKSIDTNVNQDEAMIYPTEFLNSLNPSGMPQHLLILKVGSPITLLRNLDAPRLCNGTRLCIKELRKNIIVATIMTGCAKDKEVFIPRIPLIPSDLPFEFKRLQFPVRLAYAMTINKAQGQTFKIVGVDLSFDCFSHGQLYVGISRVGTAKNLYILTKEGKTKNIVYQQALL